MKHSLTITSALGSMASLVHERLSDPDLDLGMDVVIASALTDDQQRLDELNSYRMTPRSQYGDSSFYNERSVSVSDWKHDDDRLRRAEEKRARKAARNIRNHNDHNA